MTIEDTTSDGPCGTGWDFGYRTRGESGLQNNYISVNQIGYFPQLAKIAVLGDNGGDLLPDAPSITLEGRYQYEIVRVSDGQAVYTNWTSNPKEDRDSGDTVC
jgi:endoglucanase